MYFLDNFLAQLETLKGSLKWVSVVFHGSIIRPKRDSELPVYKGFKVLKYTILGSYTNIVW